MNAAEMIAAAIEKLESLRDRVAPAPWTAVRSEVDLSWQVHCSEWGHILSTGYVGNGDSRPTAELIALLHRTINAQLAILRDAQHWQHLYDLGHIPDVHTLGLDLAKAILGEVAP